jgi:nucleoside-diphosphate-sugar epimerase
VTGADGFIGSHVTEALVRAGKDVRAFVFYNSFNSYGWLDECPDDVFRRGMAESIERFTKPANPATNPTSTISSSRRSLAQVPNLWRA